MKDYPYVPGWRLNKENNKPVIKNSVLMYTKHGVSEGEWDGNEWVQYRWSCKVKDSDVLYWIHLEDLTQLEKEGEENGLLAVYEGNHNWKFVRQEQIEEYGPYARQYPKSKVSQEQPEVDLGKELEEYFSGWADSPDYGQALNSDGECVSTDEAIALARHFYELGLNARKKD